MSQPVGSEEDSRTKALTHSRKRHSKSEAKTGGGVGVGPQDKSWFEMFLNKLENKKQTKTLWKTN